MWVRENSMSPTWIGHNATRGFQILRAVPRGNPDVLLPRNLELDSFIDIHKAFEVMSEPQIEEWKTMKAASELNPDRKNRAISAPEGFDWAKLLLEVQIVSLLFSECKS